MGFNHRKMKDQCLQAKSSDPRESKSPTPGVSIVAEHRADRGIDRIAAIGRACNSCEGPSSYPRLVARTAGGLISYGVDLDWCYRRAAYFVDKILKGANPADLPLEFPTELELWVNLKTAKAPGLKIPPTVLVRADKIIE
jgi:hypothetical protein